jgi:hypothetical protein
MASDDEARRRAIEDGVNAATEAVIVANRVDANFIMFVAVC